MPCDANGVDLPPGTLPLPQPIPDNLFEPFDDEVQFRLADFLFRKVQMSQGNIDELLELWALSQKDHNTFGPFADHDELYDRIDAIKLGDAPWKCIISEVPSDLPQDAPSWQRVEYQIWYRDPDIVISNMLANTDFANEFNVAAYVDVDAEGKRRWCDFMSGNYAWRHSVGLSGSLSRVDILILSFFRAKYTLTTLAQGRRCMSGSYLVPTKPLCLLLLVMSSTTRFTFLLETFTILCAALIGMV